VYKTQRDKQMNGGNFKGRRIEGKGEHDRELKGKERIETVEAKKKFT
jgi:hypothetical protein